MIYAVIAWVLGIILYIVNLFQVMAALSQSLTVLLALKVLGVGIPPLGALMGPCSMF